MDPPREGMVLWRRVYDNMYAFQVAGEQQVPPRVHESPVAGIARQNAQGAVLKPLGGTLDNLPLPDALPS